MIPTMMSFKDLAQQRRSHRKFTNEEIDPEDLKLILRAALMSPTSKGQRSWQFVVVDDKLDLEEARKIYEHVEEMSVFLQSLEIV